MPGGSRSGDGEYEDEVWDGAKDGQFLLFPFLPLSTSLPVPSLMTLDPEHDLDRRTAEAREDVW